VKQLVVARQVPDRLLVLTPHQGIFSLNLGKLTEWNRSVQR
jgi:hypothetical protein